MRLKSFNFIYCLLTVAICFTPLKSEEEIDIWNKKEKKQILPNKEKVKKQNSQELNFDAFKSIGINQKIKIEDNPLNKNTQEIKAFGIYDPAENDFNLNMWTSTKADDIQASLNRIEKTKLSKTANQILERILLSSAYAPEGMSEEGFADLKINWLIKNQRSDLIESFLKQNNYKKKSRAIQFLVDENIAKANIEEGCKKIEFIDA